MLRAFELYIDRRCKKSIGGGTWVKVQVELLPGAATADEVIDAACRQGKITESQHANVREVRPFPNNESPEPTLVLGEHPSFR